MYSGIYQISGPGKVYIGQSGHVEKRLKTHFKDLRKNRHPCKHLQNAYNKHGESKFVGLRIESCAIEHLTNRENFYMVLHRGALYNSKPYKSRAEC